ncbi:MAG: hypothetical protein RIR00_413, partial [Pseudomonadota bacterium]
MSLVKEPTAPGMALRTSVILFVFVIVFTAFLSGAFQLTRPAIEASVAEEKMRTINEVLPPSLYDNPLLGDTLTLPPTAELGQDEASTVYRARKAGQPAALVLEAVAPDGYAGKLRLLIGIAADGSLTGVRVTQHKETPGLGDYIDPKKDKDKAHPWIHQFTGLSFALRPEKDWKVKKDGGRFDSHTGATITPRAVIKATRKALAYANAHREQLF